MSEIIQANCSLSKTYSETDSPHVVILHNVLKYAGKIINILKFYSPQLDINLADRFEHTSDYLFPG